MKRWIVWLSLFLTLLSGCASKTSKTENSEKEILPEKEVAASPQVPVKPEEKPETELPTETVIAPSPVEKEQPEMKENTSVTPWEEVSVSSERKDWYFSGIPASVDALCQKYDAYYRSGREEKVLYLTFDEGYENGYTTSILDTLKEKNVSAAFFVTGSYVKQNPELVSRMVAEGHIVGNHTQNHPAMPQISSEKLKSEILLLEEQLQAFGVTEKYLRPPEGAYSEQSLKLTQELGYKTIFWHFAYRDWDVNDQKGTDYAYEKIVNGAKPGGIMLLHAVSRDNAAALGSAIDTLLEQGWSFQSLEQL